MIDICFSSCAFGPIREFLNSSKSNGLIEEQLDRIDCSEEAKMYMRMPSDDIWVFSFFLNYYEIGKDDFIKGRKKTFRLLGGSAFVANRWLRSLQNDLKYILEKAKQGVPIRIWYSNDAVSKCGLYFLISLLKDTNTTIIMVPEPEDVKDHWCSFDTASKLNHVHRAEKEELDQCAFEWKRLAAENAPLRTVEDGAVKSVPMDYFDPIILSFAGENPIPMTELVGKTLGNTNDFMMIEFVNSRIASMINSGKLKIVGKDKKKNPAGIPRHILKKTNS